MTTPPEYSADHAARAIASGRANAPGTCPLSASHGDRGSFYSHSVTSLTEAAPVQSSQYGGCGTYSPVKATYTASPVELQVLAYRDRWMAHKASCAARCDMRGVKEAQDHIGAAGRMLVKIAAGLA